MLDSNKTMNPASIAAAEYAYRERYRTKDFQVALAPFMEANGLSSRHGEIVTDLGSHGFLEHRAVARTIRLSQKAIDFLEQTALKEDGDAELIESNYAFRTEVLNALEVLLDGKPSSQTVSYDALKSQLSRSDHFSIADAVEFLIFMERVYKADGYQRIGLDR